jgi:hypothetical protein
MAPNAANERLPPRSPSGRSRQGGFLLMLAYGSFKSRKLVFSQSKITLPEREKLLDQVNPTVPIALPSLRNHFTFSRQFKGSVGGITCG